MPTRGPRGDEYIDVHPEFRAIFTSNPEEYAGVHRTQDALMDRLITIQVDFHDRDTEAQITQARPAFSLEQAEVIVDIVREMRERRLTKQGPSIACLHHDRAGDGAGGRRRVLGRPVFTDVCHDVLGSMMAKLDARYRRERRTRLGDIVAARARAGPRRRPSRRRSPCSPSSARGASHERPRQERREHPDPGVPSQQRRPLQRAARAPVPDRLPGAGALAPHPERRPR